MPLCSIFNFTTFPFLFLPYLTHSWTNPPGCWLIGKPLFSPFLAPHITLIGSTDHPLFYIFVYLLICLFFHGGLSSTLLPIAIHHPPIHHHLACSTSPSSSSASSSPGSSTHINVLCCTCWDLWVYWVRWELDQAVASVEYLLFKLPVSSRLGFLKIGFICLQV